METYAGRSIRHCLDMIAPFEVSEQKIGKGQQEFYQFMVSIYEEMYKNPEDYMVFPTPYEEYMARRKQRRSEKKKEKEHVSDSRESTLRNTFQQAIQFYASYFYHLGLKCEGIEEGSGSLIIRREEYASVLNQMSRIHEAKYNGERYERLSKLGIEIEEDGDIVHIVHKRKRQMMTGLLYLCKAPDSKYKWMNYLRLDYKNAYSPIPGVDDICKTLPVKSSEIVKKLEDDLAEMKPKVKIKPLRGIVSDFKWKVEYVYKGKNICGFYADHDYFMLCIYFNHFQNITEFAKVLYNEDPKLFQWFKNQFPERLCKCPNNRRVYFGEEFRRICGLSNRAEVVDPSGEDVENALYIVRKYREMRYGG